MNELTRNTNYFKGVKFKLKLYNNTFNQNASNNSSYIKFSTFIIKLKQRININSVGLHYTLNQYNIQQISYMINLENI